MRLKDAIDLVNHNAINKLDMQKWADLGCGTGTFTLALANLLANGSIIYAVDKNKSSLDKIPDQYNLIMFIKLNEDFKDSSLPENLDGILMANSLHYVKEKDIFVKRISQNLKQKGSFIIVEYDTEKSNPWIPYPISFNSLSILFEKLGYNSIIKINEHQSLYRREQIYSAIIKR